VEVKVNQGEVQSKLLRLRECKEAFSVVFSGEKSRRVNGLYSPLRREIIIHNLNFIDDGNACNENSLMYTAIHELAHHIQSTEFGESGSRCHTQLFWSCLHDLLEKAESEGIYRLDLEPETLALTEKALEASRRIAALQRELGAILERTQELCEKQGVRAEDVFQRKMQLTASTCRKAIAAHNLGVSDDDRIGADQQAAILGARNPETQAAIIRGSREGKTVEQLKRPAIPPSSGPGDKLDKLILEQKRLEKTIMTLEHRLALVKNQLKDLARGPPGREQEEAS
jgi:hypothetical protein